LADLTQRCSQCAKPVLKDGLCYQHHREQKYDYWLDNTNKEDLGIVRWAKELMPEFAFNDTPEFHKELYLTLLDLYNPVLRNKYERLRALVSFRGSAKSTAANTIYVSYVLANNGRNVKVAHNGKVEEYLIDERTIVIISETHGAAEDFTVRIRDSFLTNTRLRYYYRVEITSAVDDVTGQLTRSAFKINNCFVQGIGSGQMIRGKVKGASRPSLVIADDIYSENTVITEERRTRTRAWWNNAVMNSVDDLRGKVLILGTIVHEDTVLVDAERNPRWGTQKIAVMPLDKFHNFINSNIKVNWETSTCILPYDEVPNAIERQVLQRKHFDKIQSENDWGLAWPARIDLYLLAIKYQESVFNNTLSGLYQEYFHITVSPYERRFKRDYFRTLPKYDLRFEYGYNWIRIDGGEEWSICNIEFGIDIAGTGKDEAVITVAATTPERKVYILYQAVGKWSIRDNVDSLESRIHRVVMDRSQIRGVGLVDEAFRLAIRYRPSKIKVGAAGEEQLIINEMRRVFEENRNYTNILTRAQTGGVNAVRKEDRIRNTLLPYYETRMVYHAPGLEKLEYQLEFLGKTTHDDCADAAECALYQVEFPQDMLYSYFNPVQSDPVPSHLRRGHPEKSTLAETWRWL